MRLNRYIASATGISRRKADTLIQDGQVTIDSKPAVLGQQVEPGHIVKLNGQTIALPESNVTIMLNKPIGITVSREGQGSKTIYDILPETYSNLKPIGRLDKASSGLLLLTTDGKLSHSLSHPSSNKLKVYNVTLSRSLTDTDEQKIESGVMLEDGLSLLKLDEFNNQRTSFKVSMSEGRNRQIRRTFAHLGYDVLKLHRQQFGEYEIGDLAPGEFKIV